MMSSARVKHLGALSAMAGSVMWLILWIHFLRTHGFTSHNLERLWLGLTWLDTDKLVVIPLLLLLLTLVGLRHWQKVSTGRMGTAGYVLALVGITTSILGQALLYWPVPWGYYPPESYWNSPFIQEVAVPLWIFSTPVLRLGIILFGVDILRRKPLPSGNPLPLLLGVALFTTPWLRDTVHAILVGLVWGALGYILWISTVKESVRLSPNP